MVQPTYNQPVDTESDKLASAEMVHNVLRILLAVRYRKNLVVAVMVAAALLGWLYYATAPRVYAAKASMLITQSQPDSLDTSITNKQSLNQTAMPTFEKLATGSRVLEEAVKQLAPADRIDFGNASPDRCARALQSRLNATAVRSTNILELSYRSKDPQVAVQVVDAVVKSYMAFMDRMHKGTAGEISRLLTQEREQQADKLAGKQAELLAARRHCADLGFRSEGKTIHPIVQRAVYFNDALIAAQKKRVECEALLANLQTAVDSGENLGQYLMAVGDTIGRELLLGSMGLSSTDIATQTRIEQDLLTDRAQLQALQRNLGPNHPEVVAIQQRIRMAEDYLASAQDRIGQRATKLNQNQLGPWLLRMVRQKLDGARKEEEILQIRFEEARSEAVNLSGQLANIEMLERDVKRLSEMNDVLLNQIASLDLKQSGQDVRVAVIEEPVAMASFVSPNLKLVVFLVIFGGVAVSLGLVTLLDILDDRFRSVDEMQDRLGLPLLTLVQRLEAPASTGINALVTHAMSTSTASESFRTLRTALTLTHTDLRQIVVTSSEPGDGKTTTLANLAVCYAQAGKRTLLIDADLRRPGLTGLMDMRGPHGLSEVLRSDEDIAQLAPVHIRSSGMEGLDVLPSGPRPSDPAELLSGPRLSQLLAWGESVYDLVLVDSPPLLAATDTAIIGRLVDGVILVVQPSKNRRRLVTRVVERLHLMKIAVLGLVANHTGSDEDQSYYGYHAYGYGYGYGYGEGYGSDYGDEETDPLDANGDMHDDACVAFDEENSHCDSDAESQPLRVPKRVA